MTQNSHNKNVSNIGIAGYYVSSRVIKAKLLEKKDLRDYCDYKQMEAGNTIKGGSIYFSSSYYLPSRIFRAPSEPNQQYPIDRFNLKKQKSVGCEDPSVIQGNFIQKLLSQCDQLGQSLNKKMESRIDNLLKGKESLYNIQRDNNFHKYLKYQLTIIKEACQRYQQAIRIGKMKKQKQSINSQDTPLLPQYIRNRKIIKKLCQIVVETRQEESLLLAQIKNLHTECCRMIQYRQQIEQVEQWILLYLFANDYLYHLHHDSINKRMEDFITNHQFLSEIYPETQSSVRPATAYYIQQFLDKMLLAINQLYDSVPFAKIIEIYNLWANLKIENHQKQFVQAAFKKTFTRDCLKKPLTILQSLLRIATSFPESNQYHHSLFHPSGQNLLRYFSVMREINKTYGKYPKIGQYNVQFIHNFIDKRLETLEEHIDSLELPSGRFIHYDIHRIATQIIYVQAEIVSMLDQHCQHPERLQQIKDKVEEKLQSFQKNLQSLRSQDQQILPEEANLYETTISECKTIDGFFKSAKRHVQNKVVTSEILLFGMMEIISKDLYIKHKEEKYRNL